MSLEFIKRNIKHVDFTDDISSLSNCDVLLFCHDADRFNTLNDKAYSPLCDSVREDLEKLGLKCISIAHFGSILTGNKGYGSPVAINRSFILYYLAEKIIKKIWIRKNSINVNLYSKILQITKPKVIITIGSPPNLCSEARNRKILHFELLHGMGYESIEWNWDKLSLDQLPQAILSLDHKSTQTFSPLIKNGIKIKTISHPYLKRFLPKNIDLIPDEWKVKKIDKKIYKKVILITISWGYAGDHISSNIQFKDILSNGLFYNEISELVSENKNIYWRFRLHPVQLRAKKYQKTRDYMDEFVSNHDNSEWKESSHKPLPSVISQCDGNISMLSMSCYDVSVFGLKSLVICPTVQPGEIHENMYEDLIQEGYVTKAINDKTFIKEWVNSVQKINPRLSNMNKDENWLKVLSI